MRKQLIVAATAIMLGIATTATGTIMAGIGGAMAAETGTKTMPDSSLYPPPTPAPVFGFDVRNRRHHWCYLPSRPCDNQHEEHN
jgi:hypothetical protein